MKVIKIRLHFIINEIINIGPIFCHVIIINPLFQSIFSITLGNQKWKGGAPNFIINEIIINFLDISKFIYIFINK